MTAVRVTLTVEIVDEVGTLLSSVTNTADRDAGGNRTFVPGAFDAAADDARRITRGMLADRFGDRRFS